ARKDVAYMLRQRETLMWVFLMPILFVYFIGTVTGGSDGPARDRKDPLAVRGAAGGGFLADELIRRLEAQDFDIRRPASDEAFRAETRRLTIPAPKEGTGTFTDAVLAGQPQVLVFERQEESPAGNFDQIRIARAAYEVLGDLAAVKVAGKDPGAQTFADLRAMPRALTLTVKPAGRRVVPPSGFSQAIPGTMVMFTMLVLLTSGAITLVVEREQGLLRRLASTPISAGSLVAGKWMGRMALALVQIAFAMIVGRVVFGLDWGRSLPMVALVLVGWAAFAASSAVLLSSLTRSVGQTTGLGVMLTMVLAALGGCWWPIEITPDWMQTLARILPTGWAMDAMHKLINFGDPAVTAVPHVATMAVGALVVGWLGTRWFRYQ
ncbi:MAG TPA: ABC transporter permease, partial [Vicinamibacterales bacterium]